MIVLRLLFYGAVLTILVTVGLGLYAIFSTPENTYAKEQAKRRESFRQHYKEWKCEQWRKGEEPDFTYEQMKECRQLSNMKRL